MKDDVLIQTLEAELQQERSVTVQLVVDDPELRRELNMVFEFRLSSYEDQPSPGGIPQDLKQRILAWAEARTTDPDTLAIFRAARSCIRLN